MKYLFKAIEDVNKSELTKSEKQQLIEKVRGFIKSKQVDNYYPTVEEIEERKREFWRYRSRKKCPIPYFRKIGPYIWNLNEGYYINSIRKAIKSGNNYDLKLKEEYYEVGDKYYWKDDYFLFENNCYLKKDYCVEQGKLVDKTLLGKFEIAAKGLYYKETYVLDKKPIEASDLAREYEGKTKFFISINTFSRSENRFLQHAIRYKGVPMVSRDDTKVFYRYYCEGCLLIPVEEIKNVQYDTKGPVGNALNNLRKRLEEKNLGSYFDLDMDCRSLSICIVAKNRGSKKIKILENVFRKTGNIYYKDLNKTIKMISDIMEVK